MTNSEKYYVYKYTNPLKNDEEFYIGYSGEENRWKDHLNEAKKYSKENKSNRWIKENGSNPHKIFTILKILKAGLEPKIAKVIEQVDRQTAKAEEIRLIAFHGRADKGLGPLTNKTDGGDGGTTRIPEDLTGQKFGKLTIMKFIVRNEKGHSKWLCECECGNEKIILGNNLKSGLTKSCGCICKNSTRNRMKTHDKSYTPEHKIWRGLLWRCSDKNQADYKNYGALGIKVCDRWSNSFENFLEDMGDRPIDKHVMGRIDTTGNYEPNNCSWMTKKESCSHSKLNKCLTIGDKTLTIMEWVEISGTNYKTLTNRLYKGWDGKEAVFGKR